MTTLTRSEWQGYARRHQSRADALTAAHRERRVAGRAHPVADFLFVYYNNSPARLRRWHPGAGVRLLDAADSEQAGWRHYRTDLDGSVELDVGSFMARRGSTVRFVDELLEATLSRPAFTGCFGLHEWAMVYRLSQDDLRHDRWPLRLGSTGTDEVVEAQQIRCSHVDAFRFFTPEASGRNALQPSRESQVAMEQPGCLHAGMDIYKWCFKLTPAVPGDVTLDAFELAGDLRTLDMQASPYDLAELGLEPIRIETAAGKRVYAERQRSLATRSNALRHRLLQLCEVLRSPVC